jgi:hypothetical protein
VKAAIAWLDRLEVDPVALTDRDVKGKKKLGEALGAYIYLLRYSDDPEQRSRLALRIEELASHTHRPEYHDMLVCEDREFDANSMSYFRVAWLMEEFGLDITRYRAELETIRPRLEATLAHRRPGARAQFAWYYDHFGWAKPAILREPDDQTSLIARRVQPRRYRRLMVYELTHEISMAYRFGLGGPSGHFDAGDRAYLRRILGSLTIRFSHKNANADLVAELVSVMTYLGFDDLPAYRAGVQFLLRSQNPNGSWGQYQKYRKTFGDDLDAALYLHTTMVALRALLEWDDRAWARSFDATHPTLPPARPDSPTSPAP